MAFLQKYDLEFGTEKDKIQQTISFYQFDNMFHFEYRGNKRNFFEFGDDNNHNERN